MLTLEQVLAQSLRTSRPLAAGVRRGGTSPKPSWELPTVRVSERLPTPSADARCPPSLNKSPHASTLQNPADLLTALRGARALGEWMMAMEMFTTQLTSRRCDARDMIWSEPYKEVVACCAQQDTLHALTRWLLHNASTATAHINVVLAQYAHHATQWTQAFTLFKELVAQRTPDQTSCNILLSACTTGGQWEAAVTILRAMEQRNKEVVHAAAPTSEHIPSGVFVAPDAVSYAAVLMALESSHKKDLVGTFLSAIPKQYRTSILTSYAALIHVWSVKAARKE